MNIIDLDIFRSKVLVEQMDKQFPNRVPDPRWSDREIWMYVGQRSVVELMKRKLQEAEQGTPVRA
jgi:hypothetical protein